MLKIRHSNTAMTSLLSAETSRNYSLCDECFAPGVVVCEYTRDSLCLRHVHISP